MNRRLFLRTVCGAMVMAPIGAALTSQAVTIPLQTKLYLDGNGSDIYIFEEPISVPLFTNDAVSVRWPQ